MSAIQNNLVDTMHIRDLSTRVQRSQAPSQHTNRHAKQISIKHARFDQTLEQAQRGLDPLGGNIRLSAHAIQRLEERDISLTKQDRIDLGQAITTLQDKGARNALILRADAAFVVNVPNRTMVTAISQQELQQRIFTQIDSTMLL